MKYITFFFVFGYLDSVECASHFAPFWADGNFTKAAIAEFVSANKVPLVINFTREGASLIFENAVKNQVIKDTILLLKFVSLFHCYELKVKKTLSAHSFRQGK